MPNEGERTAKCRNGENRERILNTLQNEETAD